MLVLIADYVKLKNLMHDLGLTYLWLTVSITILFGIRLAP
jgi:hypothetical protein